MTAFEDEMETLITAVQTALGISKGPASFISALKTAGQATTAESRDRGMKELARVLNDGVSLTELTRSAISGMSVTKRFQFADEEVGLYPIVSLWQDVQ